MPPRPRIQTPRLPFEPADPPAGDLPDAADRADAVDPTRNIVLEASAGTGKTRVLVDRYVNLIKAGVDPRNILAITFTRKAAAEMRERIVDTLRRSAGLGEIDAGRWRDLSGRVGEIAVSTIDAFCLTLLREFPLEADLDPGFSMADETEVLRYVDDALDQTLRAARGAAAEDPAVRLVVAQLGDARVRSGLAVLLERRLVAREILRRFLVSGPAHLTPATVCRSAVEAVRRVLLDAPGGVEALLANGPRHHPRYALLVNDVRTVLLADWPDEDEAALASRVRSAFERLAEHFLTQGGTPRSRWSYTAADCDSPDAWRRHREAAAALAPRVAAELVRFRRDLNVVLSRGVWRLFEIALAQYRRTLARHAVVDFPDALWRTLALLEQMDEFARSRYLLEARYHHLLVDEFQDTSQAQWDLVWRLVQAWAAGLGIGQDLPLPPSIFIVGDRKQSIYGFRDADVGVLARAAGQIGGLRPEGGVRRTIRKSFRAAPELLAFTNDLFAAIDKAARHDAFTYQAHDRFPVPESRQTGDPPVSLIVESNPGACALQVAGEIARLLEAGEVRDRQTGLPRRVRPGDVGILFRSREGHQAVESALEARGIAAYVYKGLGFFDADEIKDIIALLRYLAAPDSELRAAAFARSRIVRLSDAGLQALAPRLAEALQAPVTAEHALSPEDRAVLGLTRAAVDRWLPRVDRVPPADLLDLVIDETAYLSELKGPRASQARENLKKIRGIVRRIQNRGYATVERVAAHLDRLSAGDESNAVIDAVNAVNLMTVHAAKGLEFPIVFIVNLGKGSGGSRPPIRLVIENADGEPSVAVGDYQSETDADAAARELEETKRLLYVAVTRARERLYLSAVVERDRFKPARGSLGEVLPEVVRGLIAAAATAPDREMTWAGESSTHRLRVCRTDSAPACLDDIPAPHAVPFDLEPLEEPGGCVRIAATALPRSPMVPYSAASEAAWARLAGTLVHRVLEDVRARDEDDAALASRLRALIRPADRADARLIEDATAAAVRITRGLFARPGVCERLESGQRLAEVPFSLRLMESDAGLESGGECIVHGTIDTLIRTPGRVIVVEFKTGTRSAAHEVQLSVYVDAARALFPDDAIAGVLVYPDEDVWIDSGDT